MDMNNADKPTLHPKPSFIRGHKIMSQGNDLTVVENLVRNLSVDDDDDSSVELGFLLEEDPALIPDPFMSIAGGSPAWLDPINLPSGICGICGDPLQFLLQVYAPIDNKESAFHRTLSIFMCLSMKCLSQDQHEQRKHPLDNPSRSVKVFRCQLPRSNRFYAYERSEPSEHDGKVTAALCSWCRTWKGCSVCGNCKSARYCYKKHQAAHWRIGHNFECRNLAFDRQHIESGFVPSDTIWPQFEIDMEVEPKGDTMSENGGYATALASAGLADEEFNSLLDSFEADADKKNWATFQERVERVPKQVLRYCRHATARPVWLNASMRPSKTEVPKCCYCGGPRRFEFQILPQLLHYLRVQNDVNSLDWSTIVIYTCEASCDGSMAYKEEFAWVQL